MHRAMTSTQHWLANKKQGFSTFFKKRKAMSTCKIKEGKMFFCKLSVKKAIKSKILGFKIVEWPGYTFKPFHD